MKVNIKDYNNEYLEVEWNDNDDVMAGQELMLRLQKRIAAAMRYWLYPQKGEQAADYRMRREEAVGEVFVRVTERLRARGFDRSKGVRLMTYAVNLAHGYLLHWLSAERRWEHIESVEVSGQMLNNDGSEVCPPPLRSDNPDPSELAEVRMAAQEITEHLKSLPPKERLAFGYTVLVGMSVREAARVIGCHPSQVSRHSRVAAARVGVLMAQEISADGRELP
jgi:RNA polymerase sigma factor (sigma-70 family)